MFLEFHLLQNFAPSNLNRDDTGNPKDAEFGGVRRARISSQCFKRAIREEPVFAETTKVDQGMRTRRAVALLKKPLLEDGKPEEEINTVLEFFVPQYLSKLEGNLDEDIRTKVMIFISPEEIKTISGELLGEWESLLDEDKASRNKIIRKLEKKYKNLSSAPDIAMFGRMLAQNPVLNIDAACQVAHALSTHRVTMEMDFWTAVDDLKVQEEDSGAGGMGFTGFDSACFYRYIRLDWEQLLNNLGGDYELAEKTVEGFIRAMIQAVPSGKQNTFAAHNPPNFLLGVAREGSFGWSLVNAFEKPVHPRNEGLVAPSVKAMEEYWNRLTQYYGDDSVVASAVLPLDPELPLGTFESMTADNVEEWITTLQNALPSQEV